MNEPESAALIDVILKESQFGRQFDLCDVFQMGHRPAVFSRTCRRHKDMLRLGVSLLQFTGPFAPDIQIKALGEEATTAPILIVLSGS